MKNPSFSRSSIGIIAFVVLALTISMVNKTSPAEQPASAGEDERLANELMGAWVHVGRPGNVREIPTEGGRFKFRTGKHWTLVRADPSGLVVEQFGGTYTLHGDEYVETQKYADATWIKDNGKSFKFTVKVEGDTMTQVGIDNPYTEVWKRAK